MVDLLDYYTLKCRPEKLARLRHYYVDVLALTDGPRPDFSFPGHWFYSADLGRC
ncbi:hypothetical protein J7E70_32375 [Variovorax paradoxus]|nr:hypothetical protein [Variovorax paradoxus]MBT2305108.1 hypothetical protein [Variovorax paradoxus]